MLVRLALDTRAQHPQADEDRLEALNIRTHEGYCAFLVRVYGFEAAVEHALGRLEDIDPLIVRSGMRALRLQRDLTALGMSAEAIEKLQLSQHIHLRSWSQAFGWLFVLERQSLLSGLIRRHLLRAIGPHIEPATSYLASYGESPGTRFRQFGIAVSAHASRNAPGPIIRAANEAFRSQRQWYSRHGGSSTLSPTRVAAYAALG